MRRQPKLHAIALVSASVAVASLPLTASAEETGREVRIRRAEALLAQEPSYTDTVQAAIRYHAVDPDTLEDELHRLRSKAATPYIRASDRFENTRVNHTLEDSDPSMSGQINSTDAFDVYTDIALAELAWDLPQAVFNTSQLQTYQQSGMQMGVMRIINRLYYRRRQLLLSLLVDPPVDQRALTAARLRVEGFTSLLNTFTGGWFGERLPEGSL